MSECLWACGSGKGGKKDGLIGCAVVLWIFSVRELKPFIEKRVP